MCHSLAVQLVVVVTFVCYPWYMNTYCWTYSHHCQIADKNPAKRWNGEFRGVRICIGFVQRDFVLRVFVCSVNFSLFSGYHAEGYHDRTDTFKLTGYHVCRVTTPELPRSIQISGNRRVITPAGSSKLFFLSSANTSVLPQQPQRFHRAWRTPHGPTCNE